MLEEERGSKQRARAAALCRKMQVKKWVGLVDWAGVRRGGGNLVRTNHPFPFVVFVAVGEQTVIQATPLKVFLAFMATEGMYHPPEAPVAAAATATAATEVGR